jgi:putative heme-binding domain-containing protein
MKNWNPSIAISKLLSCVVLVFVASTQPCVAQSLIANSALPELTQEYLKSKTPAQWAELAKVQGDAGRGVNVFYQNNLACVRCHLPSGSQVRPLGPNLGHTLDIASADKLSDEQLVESILEPSKTIRKGYESITLRLADGELVTGLLIDKDPKSWRLRNANGEVVEVDAQQVEASAASSQSLMPSGLMQQLASEQAMLDLIKYLFEIRDQGPKGAASLQPDLSLLTVKIPEYESRVDHAGLIRDWNQDSYNRGQAIYGRVCANCHGTKDQIGSLPTALRFGEGKFKNGSQPLEMYRTLTHGYGFMTAQTWMVPSQKYDVIHYIREEFLKSNPNIHSLAIDPTYLDKLPAGDTRGPEPSNIEVWSAMDYGNMLTHCYEIPGDRLNIAYKGIAVRLDPGPGGITRGQQWMVFDTDTLRWAAAWQVAKDKPKDVFIDWRDIQFNGEHGIHPRIVGDIVFSNAVGPGWASPESSQNPFEDNARVIGRDSRRYGPLPKNWGKFNGQFVNGSRTILSYSIADAQILESPVSIQISPDQNAFGRVLNIAPHAQPIELRVSDLSEQEAKTLATDALRCATDLHAFGLEGQTDGLDWKIRDGMLTVTIGANDQPQRFALWCAKRLDQETPGNQQISTDLDAELDLLARARNNSGRWAQVLKTRPKETFSKGAFAVDTMMSPESNPWFAQLRLTGLDFFSDGSMAVCSWDGDVWHVRESLDQSEWTWKRMVSGLYQPLGLKIVDDMIYLTCRDQLAALHDFNSDDEIDYIECFNNDHQVTEHFHEFAMGLQTDQAGNFYYAKSGRHALKAVVPQHGTLLRVSPDGSKTDILATGFRAANGVCLNPDGSFIVTDQEGFWNPKNRINWVNVDPQSGPKFYGNMFGYHDVTDSSDQAMEPPLCWITNAFDRSPAELLWVDSPTWGELQGGLLNLSYGYGKVYLVLHEQIGSRRQGGMIELPIPAFETGVMRGRFSPGDHHLYLCGMFSWAGNATAPGGLYRIRKLSKPSHLPMALHAVEGGIELVFGEAIDPKSIDVANIHIEQWGLKRSAKYGSDHIDQHPVQIDRVSVLEDTKTVRIESSQMKPSWGMEIRYKFKASDGKAVQGTIHNTLYQFAGPQGP